MKDRILNAIARMLLDSLGAQAARIWDGGVDVKTPAGAFRITVERA